MALLPYLRYFPYTEFMFQWLMHEGDLSELGSVEDKRRMKSIEIIYTAMKRHGFKDIKLKMDGTHSRRAIVEIERLTKKMQERKASWEKIQENPKHFHALLDWPEFLRAEIDTDVTPYELAVRLNGYVPKAFKIFPVMFLFFILIGFSVETLSEIFGVEEDQIEKAALQGLVTIKEELLFKIWWYNVNLDLFQISPYTFSYIDCLEIRERASTSWFRVASRRLKKTFLYVERDWTRENLLQKQRTSTRFLPEPYAIQWPLIG